MGGGSAAGPHRPLRVPTRTIGRRGIRPGREVSLTSLSQDIGVNVWCLPACRITATWDVGAR
jgi:hypothetical protein